MPLHSLDGKKDAKISLPSCVILVLEFRGWMEFWLCEFTARVDVKTNIITWVVRVNIQPAMARLLQITLWWNKTIHLKPPKEIKSSTSWQWLFTYSFAGQQNKPTTNYRPWRTWKFKGLERPGNKRKQRKQGIKRKDSKMDGREIKTHIKTKTFFPHWSLRVRWEDSNQTFYVRVSQGGSSLHYIRTWFPKKVGLHTGPPPPPYRMSWEHYVLCLLRKFRTFEIQSQNYIILQWYKSNMKI